MAEPAVERVALLLHFDGADGSIDIVDSSIYEVPISVSGTAQLDTDVKRFGSASLLVEESPSAITFSLPYAQEDKPFCFECSLYIDILPTDGLAVYALGLGVGVLSTGELFLDFYDDNIGWVYYTGIATLQEALWYHIVASYDGTTVRGFVEGDIDIEEAASIYSNSETRQMGPAGTAGVIHIDEVRIVVGEAVYTSAFTPPTAAFGDEGSDFDEFWTEERLAIESSFIYA